MAADLYLIEPLPPEEETGAARAEAAARPVDRLVTWGVWAAVTVALTQGIVHFLNAATIEAHQLDVNEEHNVFTWANSGVILVGSLAACVTVLLGAQQHRRELLALALCMAFISFDETVVLHENIAFAILGAFDIGDVYDSLFWPILYSPLLAGTALLLVRVAGSAVPRARRCVLVGLGLLGLAVLLEIVSTPWSTDRNVVHTIEGGFEEMAEIGGWILITTGIASLAALPFERRSRITRLSRP